MKYKIRMTNTFGRTLKDIVLENRDLTSSDVEFLVNPTSEYLEMPLAIPNMDKAGELFMNMINDEVTCGILVDTDVDGSTSATLTYNFLVNECRYSKDKIHLFYHDGKQHGLSDDKVFKEIKKSDVEFMIVPDAGTNDIKEIKELLKLGKKVLVLDHHKMEDKEQNTIFHDQNGKLIGVIANNQNGDSSTSLSGVGVVWKLFSYLTEDKLAHYLDLVAIGNVADSMNINDQELRYIVNEGLSNINNEFIKELYNTEDMTPTEVSFNIANKINAVHRYGKKQEKIDMMRAFIGEQEEIEYKPRKTTKNPNPQVEIQSLQKAMARVCGNIKTRQDNAVKDSMKKIEEYIKNNNCLDHKVLVIINDKKGKESLIDINVGGLVANKLMGIYHRPIMILQKGSDEYMGSMRGFGVDSFKDILESTNIVRTIGHNNASGIFVSKSDMPRLMKRLDEVMKDIEIDYYDYEIDCEISLNDIKKKDFDDIYGMRKLWFSDCREPMFLIKGIELDEKDIKNPFATLLTFTYDKYKFDKNYCSGDFLDRVLFRKDKSFGRRTFKFDVVVKLSFNDYNNKPMFEVVDIDSSIMSGKTKKKSGMPF